MCDFKPGDEVVCVSAAPMASHFRVLEKNGYRWRPIFPPSGLVEGAFYTIRHIGPSVTRIGEDSVWLHEIQNLLKNGDDIGYLARRFRKVQRRKTDLSIESFLTIKPGFEEPRRVKERVKA